MPLIGGYECLELVLYGIRIGGFHAGKGSIIVADVSNIMIPTVIDYLRAAQLSQCLIMTA